MPKETFINLPEAKKEKIFAVLKDEFSKKPFNEVKIATIVEKLGIARGSFYQYFENLQDSYFTILDKETIDIHQLFAKIYADSKHELNKALAAYGKQVANNIFDTGSYPIYKHRYLYWTDDLNKNWYASHKTHIDHFRQIEGAHGIDAEKIHFLKSVVHGLVKRIFTENLTKKEFLEKYNKHIIWIEKGVK